MRENYTYHFHGLSVETGGYRYELTSDYKGFVLFIGDFDGLTTSMSALNYLTHCISTGKEAIKWLKDKHFRYGSLPNVIIIQTEIDELRSFDFIRALKGIGYLSHIPVIFISEHPSKEERDEAIRVGADDYFINTVQPADLDFRIDFLTRLQELEQESAEDVSGQSEDSLIGDLKNIHLWPLKRAFDVVLSAMALLFLSPLFLLIAVAIKLDSKGPVFYVSKRAGKGYQIFDFYKFRTMKVNAESELDQVRHLNLYGDSDNLDGDALFFKVKNDPRTTQLGSFLRRTSLDELPQLINVLKGDMSLVGNRPLPLYEAEKMTKDQWAMRFFAPAGITGLWQITKGETQYLSEEERVSLDMQYARDNSLWFDLRIILKTPMALLQREEL